MTDTNTFFAQLAAPFPPDAISWRVGSTTQAKDKGMALAYIDARDVMDRLDAVCGPGGWERRHPHVAGTTTCEIAIWVEGRGWVVKSDGAGDTQVEAEKGSLSDAFKRTAVNWGIGRYLYDLPNTWVELEPAGRSFKIKDDQYAKLRKVLAGQGGAPKTPDKPDFTSAIAGAKAAIDLAADLDSLRKWRQDNAKLFNDLDTMSAKEVIRHLNARVQTLQSKQPTEEVFS